MVDGSAGTLVDAGGGVASAWNDSSGNGHNFAAAGAARPTIISSGLNSKPTCRFTVAQFFTATFQSPVPGTTGSYFWFVLKTPTVAGARVVNAGADADQAIFNATGVIRDFCGTAGPISPALGGSFVFMEVFRSNTATDYCAIAGVAGTLGTAGNGPATSTILTLNAGPAGVNAGDMELAEGAQWLGPDPGATKRAAMKAYVLAKWGV